MGNTQLLCMQCRVICREIGPHREARGKSHHFSRVSAGTWGVFSGYGVDGPSKLVFDQHHQDSGLVTRDNSRISSRLVRAIGMLPEVRRDTQGPFPFATGILGFLSIFKRSQALSPFEALNSVCLLRCQRDVRPPVEMRRGPRAFSWVSTGDSDIPSCCEMKDEPAFKPLQGNPAFFRVPASRCPFRLRQQTQGSSHIPIAERNLLLRCLCNGDKPLESKPGNLLSSRDNMGYTELS